VSDSGTRSADCGKNVSPRVHGQKPRTERVSFLKNGQTSGKTRKCDPDGHLPRDYPPGPHSRRICISFNRASPFAPQLFVARPAFSTTFFNHPFLHLASTGCGKLVHKPVTS
jgi:hypothetical protein